MLSIFVFGFPKHMLQCALKANFGICPIEVIITKNRKSDVGIIHTCRLFSLDVYVVLLEF